MSELPSFTSTGDLPEGVYEVTLAKALAHFGASPSRRRRLGLRLQRIYELALSTGKLIRFIVFGSFVTAKAVPNDVDVFMILSNDFDVGATSGELRILFEHGAAQDHFGASVFWVREVAAFGGVDAATSDWAFTREGRRRGLISIVEDGHDRE